MSIGMSYREFWYGEPDLVKFYYKANIYKIEAKNQELWLQGIYFHDALSVVISNAFSKRGSKAKKYLEQPLEVIPKNEVAKELDADKERQKIIEHFTKMKKSWDNQHKE